MPAASDLQHSPSSCQCTKDETGVQAGRHRSMQTLKFEIWDSLSTFSNVSRYDLKENTLALGSCTNYIIADGGVSPNYYSIT